jgi:hypothetical protein
MMVPRSAALIPIAFALLSAAPVKEGPAADMLKRIGALDGRWEGHLAWSGARTGTGDIAATYTVARFKNSVTENLMMDGKPYMTSVYHLDGPDLRVTHFCVESQPRLKADRVDAAGGTAHFGIVDVTNAGAKSGYVEEISLTNPDSNSLRIEFVFKGNGPRSVETIDLKRVA